MEQLICPKCESTEYYTELKSNNNVARCSKCDAFIKNIPYDKPKMYIGKYKGQTVEEIEDLQYLKWALANMQTIGKTLRTAIANRISQIEYLAK